MQKRRCTKCDPWALHKKGEGAGEQGNQQKRLRGSGPCDRRTACPTQHSMERMRLRGKGVLEAA